MKTLATIAALIALSQASCQSLAGFSMQIDERGNPSIISPPIPFGSSTK